MEKSHKIWNARHPNNPVKKGEIIHHRDGDHDNDEPDNQRKMKHGRHASLHHKGKTVSKETGNKISTAKKGKKRLPFTQEHKQKIRIGMKGKRNSLGHKHSKEAKKKISSILTGRKLSQKTKMKLSKAKMGNIIWLGRKHSKKTKLKMSLSKIGNKNAKRTPSMS